MGRPHSTRTRSPVRFASMATDSPRLAIVGSGFSGLCLGIRLKQLGIDCFTIFEKADRLGGTWRDNTYPGAASDVPSFAYCFSFEQKTDWSRKWSPQEEIRDYKTEAGRITNNWSGSTVRYWWTTRRFDREHYRAQARDERFRKTESPVERDRGAQPAAA